MKIVWDELIEDWVLDRFIVYVLIIIIDVYRVVVFLCDRGVMIIICHY